MRVVAILLASSLFACAADETLSSTSSQNLETRNKLASNKLASNKLASNKLASNKLASNKLASNKLASNMLSSADILSTPDGRDVYSYIVSCALPAGLTLVANIPGATTAPDDPFTCINGVCEFPGGVGLAPDWLDEPLDEDGQEWVSACMFARVNAHDTAEEISLHGEHPALTVSPDEAALYSIEEGAFYGNMFTDENKPLIWIACEGEGQASGEFGGLVSRDCTEPDPSNPAITQCGFTYAGFCADYTPQYPSPYACRERESGDGCHDDSTPSDHGFYYEGCHAASAMGKWKRQRTWMHVITTFVTP